MGLNSVFVPTPEHPVMPVELSAEGAWFVAYEIYASGGTWGPRDRPGLRRVMVLDENRSAPEMATARLDDESRRQFYELAGQSRRFGLPAVRFVD